MFANFTGIIGSLRTRQVEGKHGRTTVVNISIANNQGDNTLWFSKALWGKKAEQALRSPKQLLLRIFRPQTIADEPVSQTEPSERLVGAHKGLEGNSGNACICFHVPC